MANNSSSASSGIGFCGILCIVFVVLKLVDVIDWSWWWVLLPAYGPPALLFGIAMMAFCVWYTLHVVEWWIEIYKKKWRN